jgi:hypothetical protein
MNKKYMVSKGFNLVISAKSENAHVSFVNLPVLDVFSYQMINFVKDKHSRGRTRHLLSSISLVK